MPNNTNPFPVTRMDFEKKPYTKTPYLLVNSVGNELPICGKYKTGDYKGQLYLNIETTQNLRMKKHGEYSIYTNEPGLLEIHKKIKPKAGKRLISGFGLNLSPEYPYRSWGNFPQWGMALLIELSPDFERLSIWFFEKSCHIAETLFERWTSGNLNLTVQANQRPVGFSGYTLRGGN